jgi:hypothetical protein
MAVAAFDEASHGGRRWVVWHVSIRSFCFVEEEGRGGFHKTTSAAKGVNERVYVQK